MSLDLAPRKLQAAHRLLVELLADGPRLIADCLKAARRAILVCARSTKPARMSIECPERGCHGPGRWRLLNDAPANLPSEWKPRRLRSCVRCGQSMAGEHWRRRYCRECKRGGTIAKDRVPMSRAEDKDNEREI
jgi:hypothetical protein